MDAYKLAMSYIRFSKKSQSKGDSLRRQTDQTEAFCQRHGLVLDESYNFRDLGVSAYTGENATKGDLGLLLDLVKGGRIPRGITLVIEKLDRLNRQEPFEQLARIDALLTAGIRIGTFNPDRFYTHEDRMKNPYIIYEILSHVMTGYEESAKKSYRCREAWESKRQRAAKGDGAKMTSTCPPWLTLDGDRKAFTNIKENVHLMVRLFKLASEGVGCYSIAKTFNLEGLPSPKGKRWSTIYVRLLLRDRRVLGELQSYRREGSAKLPLGEPIRDYYPPIIDDNLFTTVQTCLTGRYQPRGPVGDWKVNIFKGLLYDARSKGTWGINTFQGRQGKKGCVRLVVRGNADTGIGIKGSFRYDPFESAFFRFVTDLRAADFSGASVADAERLATLSRLATIAAEKVEIIDGEIHDTEDPKVLKSLLKLKRDMEREMDGRRDEYERLKMRLASPTVEHIADAQTLIGLLAASKDPEALRRKIRARMRQLIESIWAYVFDLEGSRFLVCQVFFHDGTSRTFHTGYSLTKKPFKGASKAGGTLTSEPAIDLRRLDEGSPLQTGILMTQFYGPEEVATLEADPPFLATKSS